MNLDFELWPKGLRETNVWLYIMEGVA